MPFTKEPLIVSFCTAFKTLKSGLVLKSIIIIILKLNYVRKIENNNKKIHKKKLPETRFPVW